LRFVGVVSDFRNAGATQPTRPEIFMPMRQQTDWNQLFLLIRADGAAPSLLPSVRSAVVALDPEQPVYAIQTLEEAIAARSFQQRVSTILLDGFAAVALLLAAGRALTQPLLGVQPADPLTIAAVAATLGASAVIAAWAPAFRASRVDPIEALRYE
jgi:hypothetical protein